MIAKFNPTGTHTHKGLLKVRIDLYPEPSDKTYSIHYVDKPVCPYTEEELANEELQKLVPKVKALNPCLCHFITIDEDMPLGSLVHYVKAIFDKTTLSELDDLLSNVDIDRGKVSRLMRAKCGTGKVLPPNANVAKILSKVNTRFVGLEVKV